MRGVVPADLNMDILQQLLPMFGRDTTLQDLGVTPLVELLLDDDGGLSTACKPSGLHLVNREHLAQEVV
jgi:hypothetical protein